MAVVGLTGEQVFFIYDHTVLQKEEDDLKDAILYFHPSSVLVNTQCALCGQLMGMVGFFKHFSSPTSIISLRHNKFAVKHTGPYTLALGGQKSDPNGLLMQQLDALYNIFIFYHRSIDIIHKPVSYKRISSLQPIWDYYLANIRQYGDVLASAFHTIPWLDVPKTSPTVYLRASYLLQTCQRIDGVRAGCLFFKNRVLCSQLQTDITSKLLVLRSQQSNLPCHSLSTEFQLPAGVRILRVFLTKEEAKRLSPARKCERQSSTSSGSSESSIYSTSATTSSGTSTSNSASTETSSHEPGTMTDSTMEPSSAKVSDADHNIHTDGSALEHSLSNIPELRTIEGSPRMSHSQRAESMIVIVDVSGDEVRFHEEVLSKSRGNSLENDHNGNMMSQMENTAQNHSDNTRSLKDIGDSSVAEKPDAYKYNESLMKISNFVSHSKKIDQIAAVQCTNEIQPKLKYSESDTQNVSSDLTDSCDRRQEATSSSTHTMEDSSEQQETRRTDIPEASIQNAEQCNPVSTQMDDEPECLTKHALAHSPTVEDCKDQDKSKEFLEPVLDVDASAADKQNHLESAESLKEKIPVDKNCYLPQQDQMSPEQSTPSEHIESDSVEVAGPPTDAVESHTDSPSVSVGTDCEVERDSTSRNHCLTNVSDDRVISNTEYSPALQSSRKSVPFVSTPSTEEGRRASTSHIVESQKVKLFKNVKRVMSQTQVLQTYDSVHKDVTKILNPSTPEEEALDNDGQDEMRPRINSSGKAEMDLIRARINSMSPSDKLRRSTSMYRTRHNSGGQYRETTLHRSASCSKADKLRLRPASPSPISAFLKANNGFISKSSAESDIPEGSVEFTLPFEHKHKPVINKSLKICANTTDSDSKSSVLNSDSCKGSVTPVGNDNIRDNSVSLVDKTESARQELHCPDKSDDPGSQNDDSQTDLTNDKLRRSVSFREPEVVPRVPSRASFRKKKKHRKRSRQSSVDMEENNMDGLSEFDLYIQGNSDMLLLLLLDRNNGKTQDTVHGLWKVALPQLGDLDISVKECVNMNDSSQDNMKYHYLKFDKPRQNLTGNTLWPIKGPEIEFCETAMRMHEEFRKNPQLHDLMLRPSFNQLHASPVYGQRSLAQEQFFQHQYSHRNTNQSGDKNKQRHSSSDYRNQYQHSQNYVSLL